MGGTLSLPLPDAQRCCEGHFPGAPVLPAVALLDAVLWRLEPIAGTRLTVAAAKFLTPVRPGQSLSLEHAAGAGGTLRFTVIAAGAAVASGILQPEGQPATPEPPAR